MRHQSQKEQPHNIVVQTMCEDGDSTFGTARDGLYCVDSEPI